jgi:hypothetical protein
MSEDIKWFIIFLVALCIIAVTLILSILYYNVTRIYTSIDVNGTQQAYPVDGRCVLYTHGDHFKRFLLFQRYGGYQLDTRYFKVNIELKLRGFDLHYKWWQLRTWLYSLIGLKPNIVGSWRQLEAVDTYFEWEDDDE